MKGRAIRGAGTLSPIRFFQKDFSVNTRLQSLPLTGRNLSELSGFLLGQFAQFVHFQDGDLYFPPAWSFKDAEYIAGERTLIVPLMWQGRGIGAVRLRGVGAKEARRVMPQIGGISALVLEVAARTWAGSVDASTGLFTEQELYERVAERAERVREMLSRAPAAADLGANSTLHLFCVGMVVIRLVNAQALAEMGGYSYLERCMARLAEALSGCSSDTVLAARAGRSDFALLLSSVTGRGACQRAAEDALRRMSAVSIDEEQVPGSARPVLAVGHALFPQDMQAAELRFRPYDQARELLEKARLAAAMAAQRRNGAIMPFVRILLDGGVILRTLSSGRAVINLGRRTGAREGLSFAFYSGADGTFKGELVLLQTGSRESIAEIIHLADPAVLPEAGDILSLEDSGQTYGAESETGGGERADRGALAAQTDELQDAPAQDAGKSAAAPDGGFYCYGHGEFMALMRGAAGGAKRFGLALLRLDGEVKAGQGLDACADVLNRAAVLWHESVGGDRAFAGYYGVNGLVFCHPGEGEELLEKYRGFAAALAAEGVHAAVGLAFWPFLHYGRGEMMECVLKALEYARLLPEPRVGAFNSQAITISADRRYSQGDVFGAVEEYKLALLADAGNALAWNSLGVSMAALGRQEEAKRYFEKSLEHTQDVTEKAQAHYNLGTVCSQLGETEEAGEHFRACLRDVPDHVYALVRLGQLCEKQGSLDEALAYYEKAARAENGRAGGAHSGESLPLRCLARTAARQSRTAEARQMLCDALRRNPDDAAAMLMLAELYLKEHGAADIAEMLARHSLGLANQAHGWAVLADALRAQGKDEEAALCEMKAKA